MWLDGGSRVATLWKQDVESVARMVAIVWHLAPSYHTMLYERQNRRAVVTPKKLASMWRYQLIFYASFIVQASAAGYL